jgi:hypothetical protein
MRKPFSLLKEQVAIGHFKEPTTPTRVNVFGLNIFAGFDPLTRGWQQPSIKKPQHYFQWKERVGGGGGGTLDNKEAHTTSTEHPACLL